MDGQRDHLHRDLEIVPELIAFLDQVGNDDICGGHRLTLHEYAQMLHSMCAPRSSTTYQRCTTRSKFSAMHFGQQYSGAAGTI
jgi:hypothetical protein